MSFSSIPILDLALARNPDTKPRFLESLRTSLLEVGFLYIKNTGIDESLIQDVIIQGKAFFELPEDKKLEIQMKNVPSFLGAIFPVSANDSVRSKVPHVGYNKLGHEVTRHAVDWSVLCAVQSTTPN